MQKQYRLRWKPSDSKALTRAINKFNRRVRSLEKAHPENIGYYPERVKYGWYRDAIKTRYDLKREIATLKVLGFEDKKIRKIYKFFMIIKLV